MINLRLIAILGVTLIPAAFAQATTQDDTYIAGYAAGVLKHDLNLDMPVIKCTRGCYYASDSKPEIRRSSQGGTTIV